MAESDLDKQRHAALQILHPICVSIMKDKSKDNIAKLVCALHEIDASILQDIQQYVLFPIQSALQLKNLSESLLCGMCEALILILKKTKVKDTVIFFGIFNPLVYSLTPLEDPNKVSKLSEDTKSLVVEALDSLLQSSAEKVLADFYSFDSLPAIGQVISVLLSLAQVERSRSLQVSSLDCLLLILQTNTKYGKMNEVHLGNMFAFCLPGVTMATCKIITGDSKQGHIVLVRAFKVWCRIVTLVMSDVLLKKAQDEMTKSQTNHSATRSLVMEHLQSLNVKRDDSWVKVTASKLQILIGQICKLVSDSGWKVRLSLAETAEQLLMSCSGSLTDSVPVLLETLVGLISDDYGNVAKKAEAALEAFAASQAGLPGERALIQILEENLHNLATSLPRRIKMSDEEEKAALVKLLNGYISILGPKINCVIESTPHLQRLCLALLQSLEMDTSNISLVEERMSLLHKEPEVFTDLDSVHSWQPRKYFKHFQNEDVLSELLLACRQLGKYGNVCTLVDHLLDLYHESSVYRLSAILVINEVVVGAGTNLAENRQQENAGSPDNLELLNSIIRTLLDEYLSPSNLQLVDKFKNGTSAVHQTSPSLTPLESSLVIVKTDLTLEARQSIIKKNEAILLVSLLLEGVAKIASVLKKDFQVHLIQALYPLVENLGHENSHISSSAYAALVEVAVACGHSSLDSLIRHNADYLVGSLSLRLRHFDENRRSPRTFCVVLRYSTHDLLPLVSHSITQLLDSIDDNYMDDLVSFMPVLLELMFAIGRWFPATMRKKKTEDVQSESDCLLLDPDAYAEHFVDRIRTRRIATGLVSADDSSDQENADHRKTEGRSLEEIEADWQKLTKEQEEQMEPEANNEEEEEKKTEAPQHVQIVKEVLNRVKHLLSAKNGRLRILVLDVIAQACSNLADHERELLPQIHELWCGFIPLFRCQESFIVIKALKTLLIMAELSGDFIRQRTMKDIIPALVSYMEKQAKISSGSRSAYMHTNQYKLQLSVLSGLGPLAKNLELDSNGLDRIARVCVPYLSSTQPVKLQEASKEAFRDFISMDADAMWLLLCQSYCPCVPVSGCEHLIPVKFHFDRSSKNSFATNITELFQTFYSI